MRNFFRLLRTSRTAGVCGLLALAGPRLAAAQTTNSGTDKFAQLETLLPTPNSYRTASGAPGKDYWQQRADYDIHVTLDDAKQAIRGRETITYTNRSPDVLPYLWLQLDQNLFAKNSITKATQVGQLQEKVSFQTLELLLNDFDGGFKIESVTGAGGKALQTVTNYTMMRIDLPTPLRPGQSFSFHVKWHYNVNGYRTNREGYEYFPEDKNYIYEIACFYPRMAVYSDNQGWQHKQFLGNGEFTLPFGDYRVSITAPADHVVAATGTLQNASQVLTVAQQKRLEQAKKATKPVLIVSQQEAVKAEAGRATGTKTWTYAAKNVRDFAWASSRKFLWDAMQIRQNGQPVMCMSYYPKEGNPLWGQYSTEAVAHAIKTYSKFTIPYAYPVAISVHGPVNPGGMEYPMISFNEGRPEKDGTYSAQTKYSMISVIIHEVGHNFFPMIVNSDERQWTWMDEGLNSFVQLLTEQEWERDFPSPRCGPGVAAAYMRTDKSLQTPIMTNSESVLQFFNNAYLKPATALNILRETVMGRELFDHAFKTYAQRWAYKHPTPADFFRTMEDASAVDLDWFWRGWFYTTDHCDISLEGVKAYQASTADPAVEKARAQQLLATAAPSLSAQRNATDIKSTAIDEKPELKDFYNSYNPLAVTDADQQRYTTYLGTLTDEQRQRLGDSQNFYELSLRNVGGLVMPVIVQMTYADNTTEVQTIPAEIWRKNNAQVTKIIVTKQPVVSFVLDPFQQTVDTDVSNNAFPRQPAYSRFELFEQQQAAAPNPMQSAAQTLGSPRQTPEPKPVGGTR
ncbi:M1 family metallopeptidase [Hymenobacter sedentarius]|uniref:M1 family metallopeptidase n=1 Tax=Hymenobacter sedentarius TaxID=1411621 RepID=UPI0009EBD1FD|nr:M1 family metallopeptidase [Hymenobacter sedentarius]